MHTGNWEFSAELSVGRGSVCRDRFCSHGSGMSGMASDLAIQAAAPGHPGGVTPVV